MKVYGWDKKVIRSIKIRCLIQYNLSFVLLFGLVGFFIEGNGNGFFLTGLLCFFLWGGAAHLIYSAKTEKTIGTKVVRQAEAFEKDRLGVKNWKFRKTVGAVLLTVLAILFTILLFVLDFESTHLSPFYYACTALGSMVGCNIGETIRIVRL